MSDTVTTSSAMSQIVEWSESQPLSDWQRDALRRLYLSCPLSQKDEDELFALCRKQHSLLEDGESVPESNPLKSEHLPAHDASSNSVTIKSVSDVKYVNALADKQRVTFHEQGLTVVFGNNASGKSGYARILKTACRARSGEDILHNIYEAEPSEPASAKLAYSVGGNAQPVFEWTNGSPSIDPLSHVSVFDSKCAPIHVDDENEAAYIPVPLHVLKEMSEICRRFKAKLQRMSAALSTQVPVGLRDLKCRKDTAAGSYLQNLTADSSLDEAKRLANVTAKDEVRIGVLKATLQSDPNEAIASEQAKKTRVDAVIERVASQLNSLGDSASQLYKEVLETVHVKAEAAKVAATTAFAEEPIDGVGSDTWKALWEAARQYSEQLAYPQQTFPNTEDAVCVLCQQALDEKAIARLNTFESFVKESAQKAAHNAQIALAESRRNIEASSIAYQQGISDCSLIQDEMSDPELASALRRFYRTSAVRRGRLLRIQPGTPWKEPRKLGNDPTANLKVASKVIADRIKELSDSRDDAHRKKLVDELAELEDKVFLKSVLADIEIEIVRQKTLGRLEAAVSDTDTNKITRKSTALADSLITDAWRDRFAAEVSRLDIHHLRIELQREGGAYGATKFRVALIRNASARLNKVLSEGEYRCIALAAFLSELATSDNKSALVFDDPVSSLDHDHREAVAKRLAEEAANGRQIIVFTHDVIFLDLLSRHARDKNAATRYLTIGRYPDNSRSGVVEAGLPSNVAPASDLADGIRRQIKQVEGLYTSGKLVQWNERTNSFSIQLRKCWERAVAEVVSPVVERFSVNVNTKNVWQIAALEQADFIIMRSAYKRCSILNHEKCAEQNRSDPRPDEYYAEIDIINDWIQRIRQKQNCAQQNRPAV